MAITLVGEVVNSADAVTGYNVGNISTDDDFVQGTGAIGLKATLGLNEMYTTTLGATAPYDFSSGGGEFGYHIIMWFNTKTPVNATTGIQVVVGNGTDRGRWNVIPFGFYKGGFITAVADPASDFTAISAGTWTTTGNPGQLTNITQMGGAFTTLTSIMGNFNNIQLDQFTIGLGLRVDAGTVGSPNTFETVRAQDEDTSFWGWWSSKNGAFVGKGKLFIGPSTGSATSVFTDSAFAVVFAAERVAVGFYEIEMRGAGTDVSWTLANISAADTSVARWNVTVDSTTNSFTDTNGVWSGADQLVLSANSTLTGTTFIDCTAIIQNGATLDGITALASNVADGYAFIESDDLDLITDSTFEFNTSLDGEHAIEITVSGTYTFSGNIFTGYWSHGGDAGLGAEFDTTDGVGVNSSTEVITTNTTHGLSTGDTIYYNANNGLDDIGLTDGNEYFANVISTTTFSVHPTRGDANGDTNRINLNNTGTGETHTFYSTKAAILNTSGGLVTINVTGGSTPYVRNDGYGSTADVNVSVALEINGLTEGSRGVMIATDDSSELLGGYANSSGVVSGSYSGATPRTVLVKARNSGIVNAAIMEDNGTSFTDYTDDARDKTGTNDVTLLPATVSVNDAFYIGGLNQFEQVKIDVSVAGDTYVLTWEYWNGAWTSLTVVDGTSSFTSTGWGTVDFIAPGDWATTSVNSQGPFYYIRARVTSGGGTQPFAEEVSLYKTTKYLPFNSTGTIQSGTGLTSTAVWLEDTNVDFTGT